MSVNKGVAAGRNAGLAISQGDYLMLIDNDTVAVPEVILDMLEYMQADSSIGILAPKLVSPDGQVQRSFKSFPGLGVKTINTLCRVSQVVRDVPTTDIEPFYVIGAAQMFPRKVYDQAGPLDEKIFYGPEDADFCMSVRANGYRVVYNPDMSIVHDWQRVTTRKIFSQLGRKHLRGLLHFYWKHKRLF